MSSYRSPFMFQIMSSSLLLIAFVFKKAFLGYLRNSEFRLKKKLQLETPNILINC